MTPRASLPLCALAFGVRLLAQGASPSPQAPAPQPAPASPQPPPASPTPPPPTPAPVRLNEDERRGRERAALLVAQTMTAAQRLYARGNGGFFDEPRCLSNPWACIPAFAADAAPFVDPAYDWLEPRLGYARRFHPGPAAGAAEIAAAKASPTSLKSFAFTLTPLHAASGMRAFCADSKGRLCVRDDGQEAPVKAGLCEPCRKLE